MGEDYIEFDSGRVFDLVAAVLVRSDPFLEKKLGCVSRRIITPPGVCQRSMEIVSVIADLMEISCDGRLPLLAHWL